MTAESASANTSSPFNQAKGLDAGELVKLGSTLIALAAAIAYISGFLIHFIFLETLGIDELGNDAFRIKHIYIGILSLLFPICIITPASLYVARLRDRNREKQEPVPAVPPSAAAMQADLKLQVRFYSVVLNCYLCFLFYVLILFIPVDVIRHNAWILPLVIFTLCVPWLVDAFARLHRSRKIREDIRTSIRWACFFISAIGLTFVIVMPILPRLWRIFINGGAYYAVFIALIPILVSRANVRVHLHRTHKNKVRLRITMILASLMLYFCGLIIFALNVFPYIPANRGGGNYENAPNVKLFFKGSSNAHQTDPVELEKVKLGRCDSLLLIERTGKYIYVADATDGSPESWARLESLPTIHEVNADAVELVTLRRSNP